MLLGFSRFCMALIASGLLIGTAIEPSRAQGLLQQPSMLGGSSLQNSNWLNWGYNQQQDWRLGVQVDNTETGAYIKQVSPGSAAARANIEVGDMIVAVGGQQVGYVDRQPIDLGMAIKAKADVTGSVTLLVQDSRTGRLASIRVQLDGASTSLRGQVVLRDRIALPSDAVMTVQIENVTRPFYTVRNGDVTLLVNNQAVIAFEIPYDPNYIAASDVYQVRARVMSGGRLIYDTLQPVRVLTAGGQQTDVQIVLAAVSPNTAYTGPIGYGGSSPVTTAGYQSYDAVIAQAQRYYRMYLGRDPSQLEIAALMASPISMDADAIPIQLMSSQQYYDMLGNNDTLWLTNVFQQVIGRQPSQDELNRWTIEFARLRGSRTDLLREIFQQKRR
ncbi:MAG: YbaY family lipoprotein [Pirellulales bacterium]